MSKRDVTGTACAPGIVAGLLAALALMTAGVPPARAHTNHPAPPETTAVAGESVHDHASAAVPAATAAPVGLTERLGRFHPVAVHFPVALLLLVPLLEIGRRLAAGNPGYDTAVGLVLAAGVAGAVAAALLGLAAGGAEETTPLLVRHRALGLETAAAAVLAWVLRGARRGGERPWARRAYLAVLWLAALLTAATGYFGAELTHGAGHLLG